MPRRYFRTRRRRSVRKFGRTRRAKVKSLKRYGSRLRRGLDTVVSPVTVRNLSLPCRFDGGDSGTFYSNVFRLDPFGRSGGNIAGMPLSADQRFVQMCALYDEFRILSWSCDIVCNGPSFNNPVGNVPTSLQDAGRMTFMCQLFRSHTTSTPGWTSEQMLKAPGTILAKPRGSSSYPATKIMVFPTTLAERTNWVPTKLTADGQVAQFYAGTLLPFSPCIDVIAFSPRAVPSGTTTVLWTFSIISRFRIAFRKGLGLTSASSLNMVGDLQDRVELLKLDPKLNIDVNATLVRNVTKTNDDDDDDEDEVDGVKASVARNAADAARIKGEPVEDADDLDLIDNEMRRGDRGTYSDYIEANDGPHSIWGGTGKRVAGVSDAPSVAERLRGVGRGVLNTAAAAAAGAAAAAVAGIAAKGAQARAGGPAQVKMEVKREPDYFP